MHTTLYRIPTIQRRSSRRTQILAAASGLVAAGSVAVTIAIAGGGSSDAGVSQSPPTIATHAHPNPAAFHRGEAEVQRPSAIDGKRSAERFHHFR